MISQRSVPTGKPASWLAPAPTTKTVLRLNMCAR
jgi:hypothetical protein